MANRSFPEILKMAYIISNKTSITNTMKLPKLIKRLTTHHGWRNKRLTILQVRDISLPSRFFLHYLQPQRVWTRLKNSEFLLFRVTFSDITCFFYLVLTIRILLSLQETEASSVPKIFIEPTKGKTFDRKTKTNFRRVKKGVENEEERLPIYPLPFSSLPKYLVHFSLRASRLNDKLLFLHLLESNHRIEPSFLTNIIPVPAGKSAPQKEHFLGFGMTKSPS